MKLKIEVTRREWWLIQLFRHIPIHFRRSVIRIVRIWLAKSQRQ